MHEVRWAHDLIHRRTVLLMVLYGFCAFYMISTFLCNYFFCDRKVFFSLAIENIKCRWWFDAILWDFFIQLDDGV